jgi:hypothetical protein
MRARHDHRARATINGRAGPRNCSRKILSILAVGISSYALGPTLPDNKTCNEAWRPLGITETHTETRWHGRRRIATVRLETCQTESQLACEIVRFRIGTAPALPVVSERSHTTAIEKGGRDENGNRIRHDDTGVLRPRVGTTDRWRTHSNTWSFAHSRKSSCHGSRAWLSPLRRRSWKVVRARLRSSRRALPPRSPQRGTAENRHPRIHRRPSGESEAVRLDESHRRHLGEHRSLRAADRRRAGRATNVTNHGYGTLGALRPPDARSIPLSLWRTYTCLVSRSIDVSATHDIS